MTRVFVPITVCSMSKQRMDSFGAAPKWTKRRPLGGKGSAPTPKAPLLGPPGPPHSRGPQSPWSSLPTRQNYEDKAERYWQTVYLKKYGTLEPVAGVHY